MSRLALTVGAAALLASACSNADTLGPALQNASLLSADVAAAVSDGVGEDVQLMRELNLGLGGGGMFMSPAAAPPQGCDYNAASGWHECEIRTLPNGITIERSYAFYDASGAPMAEYDAVQTASIRVIRTVDGEIERTVENGSLTGAVHHQRDLTVSGLQGDEQQRTWNGTGESEIARTRVVDGRGTRSYELSAEVVIANVVVPHFNNPDKDPWPLSGTITKHVEGTVTVNGETRSIERTVVITFNGTQFVTVTVTGANGTETFEMDLGGRRVGRP